MGLLDNESTRSNHIFVGKWRPGAGQPITVTEPATGETLGSVGGASVEDVAEAASLAAAAGVEWAATDPRERAAVLRRAGDLWREHRAEIAEWIVREAGSIPPKADLEVATAADLCYEAAALPTLPAGEVLPSGGQHWSFARRIPVGVVSVIAPFNFPLILSIRSVAPALALGNAVLLKPDPRTAVSGGVVLRRIFEEAGLPDGLFSLLPGGADIGEAVVTAPQVRVVSFTGSTRAGRKVGSLAGEHLKRAHLELGGNNALIVLPGVDLEKAVSAAAFGSYLHQGQICMTTGRHLVHEAVYDDFVDALSAKANHLPVGNPHTDQVALGPIIDAHQLRQIEAIVKDTVDQGGRLTAGGSFTGLFYRPTVLADVRPDMSAFRNEIFGPVAPVTKVSSVDELVSLARDSEYGLSLGILGDVGEAMRIADAVPCGLVHINEQTVGDEASIPFGGTGASGTGSRVGGPTANIDAFTETQWLTVRPDIAPYPF